MNSPLRGTPAGRQLCSGQVYAVTREKVAEFAEALGMIPDEPPPTFSMAVVTANLMACPDFELPAGAIVHTAQRITCHRPISIGDSLLCTSTVDSAVRNMLTVSSDLTTTNGAQVCTLRSSLLVRAVAT